VIVRQRPRHVVPYLLAFVLGVGSAGLAACGQASNRAMIPATSADGLKRDLDGVLAAVDAHDCSRTDTAIRQAQSDLDQLPRETSVRLQRRLQEGLDTLKSQADRECGKTTTTQSVPTTSTAVPTVPTTTTPPTTPTITVPTTTTPTTTVPPTTVTTPDTGGTTTP